jgi:N-acetylmuramoyl-L-alanine amidase
MAKKTTRSIEQQVRDGLYFLLKPGQSPEDEEKAIEILSTIGFGKCEAAARVEAIKVAHPDPDGGIPWHALAGKTIAVIPGHEPGGGAEGERVYNIKVAEHMGEMLRDAGAIVFDYRHKLKGYSARMAAMRRAMPECFACVELHYDAYSPRPEAAGHHYQYIGGKNLAAMARDEFQRRFPQSMARRDNGIHYNPAGRGSGFMKNCRGWGLLTEPFFITNPAEREFFKHRQFDLALVNCIALAKFAGHMDGGGAAK